MCALLLFTRTLLVPLLPLFWGIFPQFLALLQPPLPGSAESPQRSPKVLEGARGFRGRGKRGRLWASLAAEMQCWAQHHNFFLSLLLFFFFLYIFTRKSTLSTPVRTHLCPKPQARSHRHYPELAIKEVSWGQAALSEGHPPNPTPCCQPNPLPGQIPSRVIPQGVAAFPTSYL